MKQSQFVAVVIGLAVGIAAFTAAISQPLIEDHIQRKKTIGVAEEICYKGVTYINFDFFDRQWGGVMLDRAGKPIPCTGG